MSFLDVMIALWLVVAAIALAMSTRDVVSGTRRSGHDENCCRVVIDNHFSNGTIRQTVTCWKSFLFAFAMFSFILWLVGGIIFASL